MSRGDTTEQHPCCGCAMLATGAALPTGRLRLALSGHVACRKGAMYIARNEADGHPAAVVHDGLTWIHERRALAPFRCRSRVEMADLAAGFIEGDCAEAIMGDDDFHGHEPSPKRTRKTPDLSTNRVQALRERKATERAAMPPSACVVCADPVPAGHRYCRKHRRCGAGAAR